MLNQVVNNSYWYMVLSPPIVLFSEVSDMNYIWFQCTVESFTPPSRILRKVGYVGKRGETISSFLHDMGEKSFTTVWYEYQNAPIIQQLSSWTNIFDSYLKISQLLNDEFISANKYKGECWFLCVRPTSPEGLTEDTTCSISTDDIKQVMFFEGVIPQTININTLSQDNVSNDMIQVSVTFGFDGFPQRKVHPRILDSIVNNSKFIKNNEINKRLTCSDLYQI